MTSNPSRSRRRRSAVLAALTAGALAVALAPAAPAATGGHGGHHGSHHGHHQPAYLNRHLSTHQRVADLLSRMTLAEKIGQMTQAERADVTDNPSDITTYGLGSVLSGGGSVPAENTPEGWADMVDTFQRAA